MLSIHRIILLLLLLTSMVSAQSRITTPKEEFGFNFGDDYQLANYKLMNSTWKSIASSAN